MRLYRGGEMLIWTLLISGYHNMIDLASSFGKPIMASMIELVIPLASFLKSYPCTVLILVGMI